MNISRCVEALLVGILVLLILLGTAFALRTSKDIEVYLLLGTTIGGLLGYVVARVKCRQNKEC